jgi:hypothetical protein
MHGIRGEADGAGYDDREGHAHGDRPLAAEAQEEEPPLEAEARGASEARMEAEDLVEDVNRAPAIRPARRLRRDQVTMRRQVARCGKRSSPRPTRRHGDETIHDPTGDTDGPALELPDGQRSGPVGWAMAQHALDAAQGVEQYVLLAGRSGRGGRAERRGVRGPSAGRDLELGSRFAAEPAPPRTATLNRPYHAAGECCKRVNVTIAMGHMA